MSATPAHLTPDELTLRLQQQQLVAEFGIFALSRRQAADLLTEACTVAASGLGTTLAKVLRYRPTVNDLIVEAGVGWHAGVVGNSTLGAGLDSPAGYALHTGQPAMSNHLGQEQRFRVPSLLAEHGVQSAINVVITGTGNTAYGVLEADSTRRNEFVQADTAFLQSLANVLAAGLERLASEEAKDGLLQDKDLLMREVHHRVKNSLQLVRTMLGLQSRGASPETREQLEKAAGRIMSVAAVHRRLYEGGSVAESDAALYLRGLLSDMQGLLDGEVEKRSLLLDVESMMLPADTLTPLGLIVSELVTNAVKYGAGQISIDVHRAEAGLRIVVQDEGPGFPPDMGDRRGLGMRLLAALARGEPKTALLIDRSSPHGRVVVTLAI